MSKKKPAKASGAKQPNSKARAKIVATPPPAPKDPHEGQIRTMVIDARGKRHMEWRDK